MLKKIFGYFLIISAVFFIVLGIASGYGKSPYCSQLISNYKQDSFRYAYIYEKEVKNPNGSCYNHFTAVKLISNLIMLGWGIYLIQANNKKVS